MSFIQRCYGNQNLFKFRLRGILVEMADSLGKFCVCNQKRHTTEISLPVPKTVKYYSNLSNHYSYLSLAVACIVEFSV